MAGRGKKTSPTKDSAAQISVSNGRESDFPRNQTSLEARFASSASRLTERSRNLVEAIINSPEETCFMSSRELARRFSVGAATIGRAARQMGYRTFADFASDLRQHFVERITPYTVLRAAVRERRGIVDHIEHSLDKSVDNAALLRSTLDRRKIVTIAKQIHRARRIVVIGVDFAASLAWHLAYGLCSVGYAAEAPVASTGNIHLKVDSLNSQDLLIAISFGQCLRETVEAVINAKSRGVPTFAITDSERTPLARYSDFYLVTVASGPTAFTSYVAPLAAIEAIHVACYHVDPKRTLERLMPSDKEYATGRRWWREPRTPHD